MSKRIARNSRRRLRRLARRWAWAFAVVVVVAGGIGYLAWTYGWGGVAGVGDRAPAFVLEEGEGRTVSLEDYLGRQPVVLVFYMTYG